MESVSNMAQAAAKAVWGTSESKEEPVSGKTGNTAKGEPYDAGNMGGKCQMSRQTSFVQQQLTS
jgi:hypothetical protein